MTNLFEKEYCDKNQSPPPAQKFRNFVEKIKKKIVIYEPKI